MSSGMTCHFEPFGVRSGNGSPFSRLNMMSAPRCGPCFRGEPQPDEMTGLRPFHIGTGHTHRPRSCGGVAVGGVRVGCGVLGFGGSIGVLGFVEVGSFGGCDGGAAGGCVGGVLGVVGGFAGALGVVGTLGFGVGALGVGLGTEGVGALGFVGVLGFGGALGFGA